MRVEVDVLVPEDAADLVEEALAAASDQADLSRFERLLDVIAHPYQERSNLEDYANPAPREFTDSYKTFCGT